MQPWGELGVDEARVVQCVPRGASTLVEAEREALALEVAEEGAVLACEDIVEQRGEV